MSRLQVLYDRAPIALQNVMVSAAGHQIRYRIGDSMVFGDPDSRCACGDESPTVPPDDEVIRAEFKRTFGPSTGVTVTHDEEIPPEASGKFRLVLNRGEGKRVTD